MGVVGIAERQLEPRDWGERTGESKMTSELDSLGFVERTNRDSIQAPVCPFSVCFPCLLEFETEIICFKKEIFKLVWK